MDDADQPPGGPDALEKRRRKKADKARGAWISFAGRIVAQIVGAVASVVLGIFVLQKYQQPSAGPAPVESAASAATVPARAATSRHPGDAAIAVLPLANLSGNPEQEYFADGMTEAITAGLAQVNGLRVISRTSTMRYKTEHPSLPEIARTLGVDLLVEGSVLQAGEQVRITAQLIDGATDEHLWAENYTRTLKDVIALQDAVATAIATAIKGTVSRRPGTPAASTHVVDSATYDLYLRGRHAWNTRTPQGMTAALGYFEKAVARDPEFALAHVGLADTYALQGSPSAGPGDIRARMQRAKAAAIRALDLDATLAEAHTALGGVLFFGERAFADAEAKFRRAIELNPNYPVAHEWLALLLAERGRVDEAIQHADLAVSLDPLEGTMHQARGIVHYNQRRFAEAIAAERRALELTPQLPLARAVLAKALVLAGDPAAALATCDDPLAPTTDPDLAVACAVAAARSGNAARASRSRAALARLGESAGAQLEAASGNYAAAFATLTRLGGRDNLPPVFAFDPLFDGLRAQPQWGSLAARATAAVPATR